MKKTTRQILIATTMALVLVLSMGMSVFAESQNDEASEYTMNGVAKIFTRESATEGYARVQSTSSGYTPYIISKMTLQSAPLGTTDYTFVVPEQSSTRTVYDHVSILHSATFPITTDKEYRVKIELSDMVNDTKIRVTTYAYLTDPIE